MRKTIRALILIILLVLPLGGATVVEANTVTTYFTLVNSTTGLSSALRNCWVEDGYMYLCEESGHKLTVWDVADPSTPIQIGNLPLDGLCDIRKTVGIDILFISGGGANCVYSVNVTDKNNPTLMKTLFHPLYLKTAHGLFLEENYLHVAAFDGDCYTIVDVSNPSAMSILSSTAHASFNGIHDIVVDYPYAYLASHFGATGSTFDSGEIVSVNITDRSNPIVEGICDTNYQYSHIVKQGDILYAGGATESKNYLVSINATDSANLTYMDKAVSGFGYWIALSGNYAVSAEANSGINLVDISNPASLVMIENKIIDGATNVRNVFIDENYYVYITHDGGFKIYTVPILTSSTIEPVPIPIPEPTPTPVVPSSPLVGGGGSGGGNDDGIVSLEDRKEQKALRKAEAILSKIRQRLDKAKLLANEKDISIAEALQELGAQVPDYLIRQAKEARQIRDWLEIGVR